MLIAGPLTDGKGRGMLNQTQLLCGTECGRTPLAEGATRS